MILVVSGGLTDSTDNLKEQQILRQIHVSLASSASRGINVAPVLHPMAASAVSSNGASVPFSRGNLRVIFGSTVLDPDVPSVWLPKSINDQADLRSLDETATSNEIFSDWLNNGNTEAVLLPRVIVFLDIPIPVMSLHCFS